MYGHSKRGIKKLRRKENKKNKLKALLEISHLNDQDRKKSSSKKSASYDLSESLATKNRNITSEGPDPKRMKRTFLFPLNGVEKQKDEQEYVKPEKTVFTAEQHAELTKLLKKRKMARKERAFLELNEIGEAAAITLPEDQRVPLPFDDFQHFIISSLLSHMSTKGPCKWILFKKHSKIERRIVLVIEGVGMKEYFENEVDLKTLPHFEKHLEVMSPAQHGGDLVSELSLVSLTRNQKDKFTLEYGSWDNAKFSGDMMSKFRSIFPIVDAPAAITEMGLQGVIAVNNQNDKFSRKELILTPWEMCEENYPMPFNLRSPGYVFTRNEYIDVTDDSPMWGLDCEMCLTRNGSELTRVCLVDEQGNIVYETLVKPYSPIRDYVTQYSGITQSMLKNVKTRLEDVQRDICAIVPPNLILVGQSLGMDLHALKMIHPYVIDTSCIFNLTGMPYRKSKLKTLVEEFLSLRIQTSDIIGHSPIEDALAALMLVQAKLTQSISWGNAILSGPRSTQESENAKSLLDAREAAGMARISTTDSNRLIWPQLSMVKRDSGSKDHNGKHHNGKHHNGKHHHGKHRRGRNTQQQDSQVDAVLASALFSHLTRYDNNAMLVAKKSELERWGPSCERVQNDRFHSHEVKTNRAAVRYARDNTPIHGTSLVHVSLPSHQPRESMIKADKLIKKLMKDPQGNTLYSCLLTGSMADQGNGLACVHLCREAVPWVPPFQCV